METNNLDLEISAISQLIGLYPEFREKVIKRFIETSILEFDEYLEKSLKTALTNHIPLAIIFNKLNTVYNEDILISQEAMSNFFLPQGKQYRAEVRMTINIVDVTPQV